jgi:flavin-binding protein dodecin
MSYDAARIYKKVEIIGISTEGYEAAIQAGISKANKSLAGISWFEVQDMRGHVDPEGRVSEYQVVMKVAFELK